MEALYDFGDLLVVCDRDNVRWWIYAFNNMELSDHIRRQEILRHRRLYRRPI